MRKSLVLASWLLLAACSPSSFDVIRVDDQKFEYQDRGEDASCVVLFEAGMGFDLTTWDPVFDESSSHCRSIRYSRLGQGNSEQLDSLQTARDYAHQAHQLLNALEVDQPIIYVAHSYGANIARHFAASFPERVRALVLVDPATEWERDIVRALDPDKVEAEISAIQKMGFDWANERGQGTLSEMTDFWKKEPLPGVADIGDIPVVMLVSTRAMPGPDFLLGSEAGMRVRADMLKKLTASFTQGTYIETHNSGHFIQNDEPELIMAQLLEVLDGNA